MYVELKSIDAVDSTTVSHHSFDYIDGGAV